MNELPQSLPEATQEPTDPKQLSSGGWYLLLSFVLPTIFILVVGWLI